MEDICETVEQDPDYFLDAVESFCKKHKSRTSASLKSKLICYGKFNGMRDQT